MILARIQNTDWRNFFRRNGQGQIESEKYLGWNEQQNSLTKVFSVFGKITGGPRGEGFYGSWSVDDTHDPLIQEVLKASAIEYFRSYALTDCRCRMGLHWKCKIHKRWVG
jgi:hypothetical protein